MSKIQASFGSLVLIAVLFGAGCRMDMQDQPKYKPLGKSDFFADGRASRPLIEGTVARDPASLQEDRVFYTGKQGAVFVATLPVPVTRQLLERGQQRFNIYCSPCHDRTGSGEGRVVTRGLRRPPSYHIDRLRQAPPGYFFDVMTNGFGVMPDYRAQIPVADRWAIIAYIRVLQLSQHAALDDVPADARGGLDEPQVAPGGDAAPVAPKEHE